MSTSRKKRKTGRRRRARGAKRSAYGNTTDFEGFDDTDSEKSPEVDVPLQSNVVVMPGSSKRVTERVVR